MNRKEQPHWARILITQAIGQFARNRRNRGLGFPMVDAMEHGLILGKISMAHSLGAIRGRQADRLHQRADRVLKASMARAVQARCPVLVDVRCEAKGPSVREIQVPA